MQAPVIAKRWIILLVLFLARTAMAYQFQTVGALGPILVDALKIDFVWLGTLQQRGSLFDDFVGAGEQRGWDGDAEHLRGLEVDDEFELGGELNWQMGDGSAFKYLVYVRCGAMKAIHKINSVANERPRFHEFAVSTNGRELSCRRGSGDICSIHD